MEISEYEYYNKLANWSFEDINVTTENYTNWSYENEIKKHTNVNTKILDLGTAAGEKLLKYIPDCAEILGTDFSEEMIMNAKENLKKSGRKNIVFKIMNNLKMNTPDDYFDLVTARHTPIEPMQIYKTLKQDGYLIIRGVDKLDCWELKRMFNRGQAYRDEKPISLTDYERVLDAGFKDVELIPLHVIEYYATEEDFYALLVKTPILNELSEKQYIKFEKAPIEKDIFEMYIRRNKTEKGIKLIRRYYGIKARK